MSESPLIHELSLYLKPPGQGIYTVSSGREHLKIFTKKYMGHTAETPSSWKNHLKQVVQLRGKDAVVLLAVPCDTGAGLLRGASRGPEAIRRFFKKPPAFDLGDVFTIPQLLDDSMLNPEQIRLSQNAIYSGIPGQKRKSLPVSPLSIATRVYKILLTLNPRLKILLLGGDHTITWSALKALLHESPQKNRDVGVVHFDAHTDLSPHRLGVKYCFSTWAWHVNERLGRGGRLVQIGVRASAQKKSWWEKKLHVKQIWAEEALKMTPAKLACEVISHLKLRHVKKIYITNDLDATDSRWAAACGTPEPKGLTRGHVTGVTKAFSQAGFEILGADLVELAPGLSLNRRSAQTSIETAARYLKAELEALRAFFI